jgi:hypothetical protein
MAREGKWWGRPIEGKRGENKKKKGKEKATLQFKKEKEKNREGDT